MKTRLSAHVVTTTRTYKEKTYRSHLLRRSYREDGKVKKETIANLTPLGDEVVELIRQALRGQKMVPVDEIFQVGRSRHHGHVQAVTETMKRLGFASLLASRKSRERSIVMAMIATQVLEPDSKLAMTRWWHTTTIPDIFGVEDADEDDLYAAMDWLLERQGRIEKKLADRHLEEGSLVLYDLTSSYFEGKTCLLAKLGHNRDGKKGKLQVNYGLLTDRRGCPVAVSVYDGDTGDPSTLREQADKVREDFGIKHMVLVGDRGMISQKQINGLKDVKGVDWITALRTEAIREFVEGGTIQLGLFDERNLFEFTHPDYPGERLVACRNPEMTRRRREKRQSLLDATVEELEKVRRMVERGRLRGQGKIGVRVGRVVNKYKVAKHFKLTIRKNSFSYRMDQKKIDREAALDGIYVVRTSLSKRAMSTAKTVLSYKRLSEVERAFRALKSIDLLVRPIRHRMVDRVQAHIFFCMLTYYVRWHMMEAWRPLLFSDEDIEAKEKRDPVAPAKRSAGALKKIHTKKLADGSPVHSFRTLLKDLSTIVRNTCRRKEAEATESSFSVDTTPSPSQQRAYELIKQISV
jgi:transposase